MAEVDEFPFHPNAPVPCKTVLETSLSANLTHVVVIGTDDSGRSFLAASHGSAGFLLYMLERAKTHVMDLAELHPVMRNLGPPMDGR